MSNNLYLALYKGKKRGWKPRDVLARLCDWATRKMTKGAYSHCEIAVKKSKVTDHYHHEEWYECYSSSIRDGGVRSKVIDVSDSSKWDLIPLNTMTERQITTFFEQTKGKKYDLCGALGVVLRWRQRKSRYFCSEWCGELLGLKESWRFSPNDLAAIVGSKQMT